MRLRDGLLVSNDGPLGLFKATKLPPMTPASARLPMKADAIHSELGCTTCHGPIDKMAYVWQEKSLLMEWCLECHRKPEKYLRPKSEVYSTAWQPPANQLELGAQLKQQYDVNTQVTCSTCHR